MQIISKLEVRPPQKVSKWIFKYCQFLVLYLKDWNIQSKNPWERCKFKHNFNNSKMSIKLIAYHFLNLNLKILICLVHFAVNCIKTKL